MTPVDPPEPVDEEASHRGAFGDYGGASDGLIDRTFRERLIIVGVTLGGGDPERLFIQPYDIAAPMTAEDCLLYTSDAADDLLRVDIGGRRTINKKHR